jgi:alkylhydroperoxidase/carboxymuconolactone decarboxylase family protein YurZ
MASIKLIPEEEATGKSQRYLRRDQVPTRNRFCPQSLQGDGFQTRLSGGKLDKVKAVMVEPGKLDRLTKEIIAVAVSAVNGCDY